MLEKKEFGDTHSRLHAEIEVLNRGAAQREQQAQQLREERRQLAEQLQESGVELELARHKNQHLASSLADLAAKVEELKKIKNAFEEEAAELRSKEAVYQNYYAEKERAVQELIGRVDELERRAAEAALARKALESRLATLSQKLQSEEEAGRKRQEKWLQEVRGLEGEARGWRLEAEGRQAEAARLGALYEEAFSKLKDQLFERNDLELKYNQSLSVVEAENDHIKQLNIRISEYQEKLEDQTRRFKGLEFVMDGKERTFRLEIAALTSALARQQAELQQRKAYPHPLLFEDLLSELQRARDRLQGLRDQQVDAEKLPRELQTRIERQDR